jgi:hypothetical protein
MARNRKNKARPQEEEGAEVGEWIVTFSDCMTLLLCFFVLLLTFSSFEDIELQKLAGAFEYMSLYSIFPIQREIRESMVPPIPRQVDQVAHGAETPQEVEADDIQIPRQSPEIFAVDAFKDRRVFYIRSKDFFFGAGQSLTPKARAYLKMIARFVKKVPCRVVVSESTPAGVGRARAAVVYLTAPKWGGGLPVDSCYTAAPRTGLTEEFHEPVVEVSLLAWKVY